MNPTIASLITTARPLQVILEKLSDGQFSAWMVALPDCRVVADLREAAIEALKLQSKERMKSIEIIEMPDISQENPWLQFLGVLKDDQEFAAWHDRLWAEKQRMDDDEEILTIEEMMEMA
jgi:hypothetical protein